MYRRHERSSRTARKWLALFLVFAMLFSDVAPAALADTTSIVVTKNESEQAEVLTVASTDAAVSEPVEITEKAPVETISTAAKSKASVETISTGAKPKAKTTSIFSESKKIGPLPTVSEVKVEDPSASSTEEGSLEPREDIDAEKTEETETGAEETESLDYTTLETNNAPVRVSITFSADAEIPEGVELVVTDPALESNPVPLRNTLKAAQPLSAKSNSRMSESAAETPAEYPLADVSLTEWKAGESEPEIELYHRQLEISLIGEDGSEIEPNPEAEVTVCVTLPDLEEGLTVDVYHETDDGSILLNSTTDGQTVTFTTNSFSLFDFTVKAQQLTSWMTDLSENTFYGKTKDQPVKATSIQVTDAPEGLDVLEAFSVTENSGLWMTMHYIRDLILGKRESVVLYTVEDGKLGEIVKENISIEDIIRFNLGDLSNFALVRDSGLRRHAADLGEVFLDGMMPKNATAEATNVTETYTAFRPEAGENAGTETNTEAEDNAETDTDAETEVIAAYDIAILNGEEKYQPDEHPISVTIRDEAVAEACKAGKNLRLWHIADDGTQTEITDFRIEDDCVVFDSTGFSVYVVTHTIEEYFVDAEGATWRITAEYNERAELPDDVELQITEISGEAYIGETAEILNTQTDYLYYTKFLDISFVKDGETFEPKASVKVSARLMDVTEGAEQLQVVHFADSGAEKLTSVATEEAVVTFAVDTFSVFGFGNVLQPLATTETDDASVEILGFDGTAELVAAEVPEVEEGLEVLSAFTLGAGTEEATDTAPSFWIKAELKEETELSDMESVVICAVDGEETKTIIDSLSTDGQVAKMDTANIAVVKDSGYRCLNFVLNMDHPDLVEDGQGTEDRIITLNGMMPKAADAVVTDVTEQYADYEYIVPEEETEENPEEGQGEPVNSSMEAESDPTEGQEEEQPTRTTLAAYSFTISNNDSEYQPDAEHPINVEIVDPRITINAGKTIELWHIRDDGTQEQVTEFTVEEGRIAFEATGFSVYVVINHEEGTLVEARVEFHFISDKDMISYGTGASEYYQGKPYSFPNKHGDSQTTQILKDGESLELIKDPDNKFVEGLNKFFYGWYVVPSYSIDGITDEYGIGTADSKLYFTWPANPPMITFEQPISISADNNAGGSTAVNWNLDGVSGSGIPDNDGNIHVFLIPVFEKYSFVNFMLYAWNTAGISNMSSLMARKLIVMGTSDSVDVKISDVRSTSQDPVHLIFTGWAYNRGTDDNPNWEKILTVDSSGHEINEDQGGVYLTLDNLADDMSVDLYPIFVEARWVDFDIGVADNGASYVPSRYLHAWGMATPYGTQDVQTDGIHYFSKLDVSSRPGYSFDGWYAFAVRDEVTGEILNLNDPMDIQINYVDVNDKYSLKHVTIRTTAIKVTDENGNVIDSGTYSIEDDGQGHVSLLNSASGEKQFGTDNGQLKFYDPLEEMKLTAKWSPASSQITIVYWTEDVQGKEYTAPQDPKDDYTATAIKVITTEELNSQSAVIGESFYSGSILTRNQLLLYQEGTIGVLDTAYLDEAGAVLAGEEKFYTRNDTLSDEQVVINGDGSTTINVYYSRMEFKLVFHIGRDGYVKSNGQQKTTAGWDPYGNWIEYMFDDAKLTALLGHPKPNDGTHNGASYAGVFSITYQGKTYTSEYETNLTNIMGDYVPPDSYDPNDPTKNVYVITAKYGAYIGDRWPTPVNNAFTFTGPANATKKMYIWAAYYGSLYCRIANERSNYGNSSGNNPDINGIYEYMSAELCSNRAGTDVINDNHVHHLVAWFGEKNKAGIDKHYHIYFAAIEGTYDPADHPVIEPGSDYLSYNQTTWSDHEGNVREMTAYSFYKERDMEVISNLEPQFQLITNLDGYDLVYSCYNTPQTNDHHIYFFFVPKQYTLSFNFGNTTKVDTYHYTRTLADADKYTNEVVIPEGYYFKGWYTNTAGAGDSFDFANETMPSKNLVLYPIISVLEYMVKIDPAGGVIDHRSNPQTSTYFYGNYGEPIGEYTVSRDYIELTEKEKDPNNQQYYTGTRYRYINTQFLEQSHEGTWGYPYDLRNAVYVAEDDIDTYYGFYCNIIDNADTNWWEGITKLSKDAFLAKYSTDALYRPVNGEHYTFMGWYEVDSNGKVSNMPYNFNDPVSGPMELRAKWRLDGGFYLQYNPYYFEDDGQGNITAITGDIDQWHDPQDPHSQLYADQSPTQILHAPKNVLSTDSNNEWVFRGWRVVRANGTFEYEGHTYIKWEPLQYENGVPVYYQPGQQFIVDASYATETSTITTGNVIHMQAYYERLESSDRRPDVTNLIIDANDACDGYVNTSDSGSLPALSGPGTSYIDTENNLDTQNHPTQILLGDFQSNIALHLYQYATGTGTVHNGVPGANFFNHINGYKLIGFDENADPENPTTGHAYVPAFASDGVIAVTRNESKTKTIYAMWEPMVYVTFVNNTAGPISIGLTGTDTDTVSIVNEVTGEFDRQPASANIDLAAGDRVKVALPKATVTGNAATSDTITATVTNNHLRRMISVSGEYPPGTAYGTGSTDIKYGSDVIYTGTLVVDPDGIVITYTEDTDAHIVYDVNGGTWTDTDPYQYLSGDNYTLDIHDISHNIYKPTKPTYTGKVFIGWTIYPEIAAMHDFSTTDPLTVDGNDVTIPEGSIQLDVVRDHYLWDFERDPSDLYENDKTLYAVWSDTVTVTFNIANSTSMSANPLKLHNWTDPATTDTVKPYVFYRSSGTDPYITYTMAIGEYVPIPDEPTANSEKNGWTFLRWLYSNATTDRYRDGTRDANDTNVITNIFDFTKRVLNNVSLTTSWTMNAPQTFTFRVENDVVNGNPDDEFIYTIAVSGQQYVGKPTDGNTNQFMTPETPWGSFDITLKNDQHYTVRATVYKFVKGWTGYSAEVEVLDQAGVVLKTGRLFVGGKQTYSGFTSDYQYTLKISQQAKNGYETFVSKKDLFGTIDDPVGVPLINNDSNTPDYSFTFFSSESNTASNNQYDFEGTFKPEKNYYDSTAEHNRLTNGLTIVFTNTCTNIVAPTGFTTVTSPFVLMLLAGLLLLAGIAVPIFVRKRRHVKAETCEVVQINDPGPIPPCLKANLWEEEPPGKRGDTG